MTGQFERGIRPPTRRSGNRDLPFGNTVVAVNTEHPPRLRCPVRRRQGRSQSAAG
jgi:hypothetical protein